MASVNIKTLDTFSNKTIDTTILPRFEDVVFTPLQPKYWNVLLISIAITFVIFSLIAGLSLYFTPDNQNFMLQTLGSLLGFFAVILYFSRLSFSRKGYAFREHDVLFKSGVISTTTTIIPYNRIQHVALHEGFISRTYNLAEIQIFTAGGSGSDLQIPGIAKDEAENIKQLLMGQIKKQL